MDPEFSFRMKRISYERLSGNMYVNRASSAGATPSKQENGHSSPFHSGNPPWALEFVQVSYLGSQQTGEGTTGLSPVSVRGMAAREPGTQAARGGWRCQARGTGPRHRPPGRLSPGLRPVFRSPVSWWAWQHCPLLEKRSHRAPPGTNGQGRRRGIWWG